MSGSLLSQPIIPVVVTDRPGVAGELTSALAEGGVRCAEVTLRTPRALEVLAKMVADAPAGFAVGAGTVLDPDQVDAVADAGATFVVSPGFDVEVVERAQERGLDVLPGVATATEVQRARRAGVSVVKFFPADRLGGLDTIAALAPVFPEIGFVPSGGVDAETLSRYLAHPAVPAVSGSWLAPRRELDAGDVSAVTERARQAIARAAEARAGGRAS
jgi:2-dehydro-3-deoxyphosphogluconate aldolase / (4S)-4-hydroxy-2-oxoglutarate aldolase